LRTEFDLVAGRPTYGDLVALVNEAGEGLHLCVYIADDFVFTKNGMNRLQPWVMMKIPDMLLAFPSEKPQHRAVALGGVERGLGMADGVGRGFRCA
jgi:hypothetical protein